MNTHLNLHRDAVDEMLKADARELRVQHIDDDGFTLQVQMCVHAAAPWP